MCQNNSFVCQLSIFNCHGCIILVDTHNDCLIISCFAFEKIRLRYFQDRIFKKVNNRIRIPSCQSAVSTMDDMLVVTEDNFGPVCVFFPKNFIDKRNNVLRHSWAVSAIGKSTSFRAATCFFDIANNLLLVSDKAMQYQSSMLRELRLILPSDIADLSLTQFTNERITILRLLKVSIKTGKRLDRFTIFYV